ncbi:MAG: tripartite tricarboxylate transporter substrate binding protein [Betaproteobacteria bacterium]|nr:tripartite tricarboxylate transporter substrate binding protein [Betaproteobacteria bacterium]
MTPVRHALFVLTLLALSGLAGPSWAAASYPSKPVRVVVVYPAGGGIDIVTRAVSLKLSEAWGASFVIDNRPGAGTTLGTALAARAPSDGYTLLMADVSFAISPALYRNLPYDPKDFVPVSLLNLVTDILVVHPGLPAKSVKELIARAKSSPEKILYASPGNGSLGHLAVEKLKAESGIDLVHVPYKGGAPALSDVINGSTPVYIGALNLPLPHIRAGRLRALGITGLTRSPLLPDLPTVAESGVPGYDVSAWYGMFAPTGTPSEIIQRLSAGVAKAIRSEDIVQRLVSDGNEPVGSTPAEFHSFLASEMLKWSAGVRVANAKID